MKVKCLFNEVSNISDGALLQHVKKFIRLTSVNLDVGREYIVYGMIFREGNPWFYVCDPDMPEYPVPQFSGFFEIIDPRFSKSWRLHWPEGQAAQIVPEKWAQDPLFYERLVDINPKEQEIFESIRVAFDAEANADSHLP